MKFRWIALVTLLLAGGVGGLWAAGMIDEAALAKLMKSKEKVAETQPVRPPTVTVTTPAMQAFIETLQVTGSIVSREEILIAPQVEGQSIAALHADIGETVAKGQLLATLATENLDAMVAQNAAAIDRADAGIAQAHSSITQAEARLEEADASLKRAKPLSRSGYLSTSILDQRQATATSARAALQIARDSLKLAQSEKMQAQAKQRELEWRRSQTRVMAPVGGLVLSRAAKVGSIATAVGEPMFRIAKAGELELEAEATSDQLPRIDTGETVRIAVPGLPAIDGRVRLVSPRVDTKTRLGTVKIFVGQDPRLRVGTFAIGVIATANSSGLAIPVAAVMRDDKGAYVQIVADEMVQTRRVKLGLRDGVRVEVLDGLTVDDSVVAKAGTFLGPGERVSPVPAGQDADTNPGDIAKAAKAG